MTETVRDTGAHERILFCTDSLKRRVRLRLRHRRRRAPPRKRPRPSFTSFPNLTPSSENPHLRGRGRRSEGATSTNASKTYLVRAPKLSRSKSSSASAKIPTPPEFAEENAVDLIVMGRGRSSLGSPLRKRYRENLPESLCCPDRPVAERTKSENAGIRDAASFHFPGGPALPRPLPRAHLLQHVQTPAWTF